MTPATHPYIFDLVSNVVAAVTAQGSTSQKFLVELLAASATSGSSSQDLLEQFTTQITTAPPAIRFIHMESNHACVQYTVAPPPDHWFGRPLADRWANIHIEMSAEILGKLEQLHPECSLEGKEEERREYWALLTFLSWNLGHELIHLAQLTFGNQPTPPRYYGLTEENRMHKDEEDSDNDLPNKDYDHLGRAHLLYQPQLTFGPSFAIARRG
uniref:DinB-like domain-containing protein n=1 Tax=Mycena chlorophos TaxID=658473 RepID=A0ABQ0LYG1_MYCCL|nr:predicted protein [Mycena chlorophos]